MNNFFARSLLDTATPSPNVPTAQNAIFSVDSLKELSKRIDEVSKKGIKANQIIMLAKTPVKFHLLTCKRAAEILSLA